MVPELPKPSHIDQDQTEAEGGVPMVIRNSTAIPNGLVREIIRFTRPPGIGNFDVMVKNAKCGSHLKGGAYHGGSSYHHSRRPFVVLSTAEQAGKRRWRMYPCIHRMYQYGQLKGRRYYLADRIECLVYLAAHELRHLWQAQAPKGSKRRGMVWGSRGRFSEVDTESYAIRKLREWRRKPLTK